MQSGRNSASRHKEMRTMCDESLAWTETIQASAPDAAIEIEKAKVLLNEYPSFSVNLIFGQRSYGTTPDSLVERGEQASWGKSRPRCFSWTLLPQENRLICTSPLRRGDATRPCSRPPLFLL